jgi:hypothetical protein
VHRRGSLALPLPSPLTVHEELQHVAVRPGQVSDRRDLDDCRAEGWQRAALGVDLESNAVGKTQRPSHELCDLLLLNVCSTSDGHEAVRVFAGSGQLRTAAPRGCGAGRDGRRGSVQAAASTRGRARPPTALQQQGECVVLRHVSSNKKGGGMEGTRGGINSHRYRALGSRSRSAPTPRWRCATAGFGAARTIDLSERINGWQMDSRREDRGPAERSWRQWQQRLGFSSLHRQPRAGGGGAES